MDAKTKADFILALHKHSLKAFDNGGVITPTPVGPGSGTASQAGSAVGGNSVVNPGNQLAPAAASGVSSAITPYAQGATTAVQPIGGAFQGIASAFTTQNGYQAAGPDINKVVGNQDQLGALLMNEAQGNGPNPAQTQYLQNAQQIAQQQATNYSKNRALNPAIAARMGSNAAVNANQTAANNASIDQAKQQLAAQHELQGLTGQQQTGAMHAQDINSQVSQNNTNAVNSTEGGLLNGIGGALGSIFYKGGDVKKPVSRFHAMASAPKLMAGGGKVSVSGAPNFSNAEALASDEAARQQSQGSGSDMGSSLNQFLNKPAGSSASNFGAPALVMPEIGSEFGATPSAPSLGAVGSLGDKSAGSPLNSETPANNFGAKALQMPELGGAAAMASGGMMQTMMSLAPLLAALNKGGQAQPRSMMLSGGPVKAGSPSEKAQVKDNSLKNDKIPAVLSQGEIVLPRSVTMHAKAPEKAAEFVRAVLAKRKVGSA